MRFLRIIILALVALCPARPQAQNAAEDFIQARRDSARVLLKAGIFKAKLGFWKEALDSLNLCVEADPEIPEAWYNLALALYQLRDYGAAGQAAGKALALSPYFPAAELLLARCSEALGQRAQAAELYAQVAALPMAGAVGEQARVASEYLAKEGSEKLPLHFYERASLQSGRSVYQELDPGGGLSSDAASNVAHLNWDPNFGHFSCSFYYTNYYFASQGLSTSAQLDYHNAAASLRGSLGWGIFAQGLYEFALAFEPLTQSYRHHLVSLQLQDAELGPSLVSLELQRLWEDSPSAGPLDSLGLSLGATQYFWSDAFVTLAAQARSRRASAGPYSSTSAAAHVTLRLRSARSLSPQLDLNYEYQDSPDWPLLNGGKGRVDSTVLARLELTLWRWEHALLSLGDEAWQDDSNSSDASQRSNTGFAAVTLLW